MENLVNWTCSLIGTFSSIMQKPGALRFYYHELLWKGYVCNNTKIK